ncbi:MAG: lamin tail domain-containing protein [Bacteroidia bacterium]
MSVSQVEDDFSDGNFTENPSWTGDSQNFTVNTSKQLQLNAAGAGTSYLSVPCEFSGDLEWSFWIKMSFAPSDNNLAKIYLASDNADLNGFLNGYFIRMGQNGANDDIGLWKQNGTSTTKIINGVPGHCAKSSNVIRVKITKSEQGDWAIYSDTLGGKNYFSEGFGSDNSLNLENFSFFGISCKYTSSNASKFYFDDFYIGPIRSDSIDNSTIPTNSIDPNDVVINEILSDPFPGDVHFVEIYNRSQKIIDLKDLFLGSFDSIHNTLKSPKTITTDSKLLYPKRYVALSINTEKLKNRYNCLFPDNLIQMASLPTMNISSGTIVLASSNGTIIDRFSYKSSMQFSLLNSTKGISLERLDFNQPTQDLNNWHSAAESVLSTPGYQNSQYRKTENGTDAIQISPAIFSPDDDGNNDVLSIRYAFEKSGYVGTFIVYDAQGRTIKYLARNQLLATEGVFSWDGTNENREKARTGIYVIYISVFNTNGDVKQFKKTCVLATKLN